MQFWQFQTKVTQVIGSLTKGVFQMQSELYTEFEKIYMVLLYTVVPLSF